MKYVAYLFGPVGCTVGLVVWMALAGRARRLPDNNGGPVQEEEAEAVGSESPGRQGERRGAGDA